MSDFEKSRKDELDDFWDIGRLVPPKSKNVTKPPISPKRTTPDNVLVSVNASASDGSEEEYKLTAPVSAQRKTEKQSPIYAEYENFSPLISRVKILNWKSTYNYYEFFCRQAAALYHKHGTECPEVHFFSYVAQYSQLNRRQLEWYLWWRECVRNGIYLKTDISYIYLLIFEIINLGNAIDTAKSLEVLIALWTNYKDTYPQLTGALGEWICDYSLIHKLPIIFPDKRIDREMISSVSFAEVFFAFDLADTALLSKFLMSFCSSYHYRKSKFCVDEQKALYEQHLPAAFEYLLQRTDIKKILAEQPKKHISRVAFTGALCSYKTRKHIEVDYLSLCESHELKSRIGDIIKYAENKLRTYLGIRSKLGVSLSDDKIKACIDEYFSGTLAMSRGGGTKLPEYEKLYEAKATPFSLASALDIERQSWEVTEKLVEAFEEESPKEPLPLEQKRPKPNEEQTELSDLDCFLCQISKYSEFFQYVLGDDVIAQQTYIKEHHIMPEAVVDEINGCAAETLGDILIEEANDGYQIIEDYKPMFE